MDLLGDTKMSMERTWKVSAVKVKLGGMPPDTPRVALPLRASLYYITHDFYHYDLMTLLKNSAHATQWGPAKELPIEPRTC